MGISRTSFKNGKKHPNWKGGKVGYFALHSWLIRTYGKAYQCQAELVSLICSSKSKRFEWANISKNYLRVRNDWVMLCKSCHTTYDLKPDTGKKISESHLGKPSPWKWVPIIQLSKEGNVIKHFNSITLAAKILNLNKDAISQALRGYSKTSGGYKWKYQ